MNTPTTEGLLKFWELERHGSRVGAVDGDTRLTYAQLAQAADAAAAALRPGQVFGLACANRIESLVMYLGALRKAAVPLLLDADLAAPARDTLLRHYGIVGCYDGRQARWIEEPSTSPPVHASLGLLMSTSGSTASPKLVRLSRENLAANTASIVDYLGIDAGQVAITSLPMHYSYGLSVVNSHLASGATLVLTEAPVTQPEFWRQMKAEAVTHLAGVPTLWRLLQRLRFERMDLPALRTLTQAGGALTPSEIGALHAAASAAGRRLFIMYGQTEATARIAYVPPERLGDKAGSIGRAIPGGELALMDAQGSLLEGSVEGELAYRGPNVMLGYAQTIPDLALSAMQGWLRTGDLARRDADGFYWITGRLKRIIKLFGHRIGLDEIEQQLRSQGLDAGVVGRDDLLQVGLAGASAQDCERVRAALIGRLRCVPAAVCVQALERLPISANGKLLYPELQAQINAAQAGAAHA